ncbi:MAG TPA: malto-oligosyltrehalose synthase [Mycobacteriales bacterium]|nr:malto-oligosyltrehalose synthase [Mycobacteriales bacterium]
MPSDRTPTATYRIQLQPGFGFAAAAAAVPYLARLGVSHLYLSPILQAVPGSTHGYDVVDHGRLSAELGGEPGWRRLVDATRSAGLGIVVDLVPNHMAIPAPEWLNPVIWDVLRDGRGATHAGWLDVDWSAGHDRLVLPLLADPADTPVLDPRGGPGDTPVLRYREHAFPLAPGTERLGPQAQLDAQHYRLAHWREDPNYRRFFNVNSLIAIRVEEPAVFDSTHRLLLDKLASGDVTGLRVDHPDGLADPDGYLSRLRARAPEAWIVVEKILEPGEPLRAAWPVAGTTGYDALDAVSNAFVDPSAAPRLTEIYRRRTGIRQHFAALAVDTKRATALRLLRAETNRLARAAGRPLAIEPMAELLAAWPVYRTYVPAGGPADDSDARVVAEAAAVAGANRPADIPLFAEWTHRILAGDGELSRRFQQTTGMVTAKGVEDTAFYRYHRLSALCEVGGNPGRVGAPTAAFHAFAGRLARDWPCTMTTLSTHDTKRAEDVRARQLVVAEIPGEWDDAVERWHQRATAPDPNIEYLFWQTLVGAWPLSPERAAGYLEKAAREAKEHTSWTDPEPLHEDALRRFCDAVFADAALLDDLAGFVARIDSAAAAVSLGSKLAQLTMPGIPDVYRGAETVSRALVDPDNRAPMDLEDLTGRLDRLADLTGPPPPSELAEAKLWLTTRTLRLRREHPEWFDAAAGYTPVTAEGPAAGHLLGFRRGGPVTVLTRLPVGLAGAGGWRDTALDLAPGGATDALTGRRHPGGRCRVADLLEIWPVALLVPGAG